MNLGGQPTPAPPGFFFVKPFFKPLPCWCTLIVVLSSISVLSSTMSCSIRAVNNFSQTPCCVHRRNRLYTLLHGPKRSGRSLQGIPVFNQYMMPLSICRLSFDGLPPCSFFSCGSNSFILFHCSSANSCRLIPSILPYYAFSLQSLGLHTRSRFHPEC